MRLAMHRHTKKNHTPDKTTHAIQLYIYAVQFPLHDYLSIPLKHRDQIQARAHTHIHTMSSHWRFGGLDKKPSHYLAKLLWSYLISVFVTIKFKLMKSNVCTSKLLPYYVLFDFFCLTRFQSLFISRKFIDSTFFVGATILYRLNCECNKTLDTSSATSATDNARKKSQENI